MCRPLNQRMSPQALNGTPGLACRSRMAIPGSLFTLRKVAIAESRRAFFRATANGVMQAWFSWRGKQGSIETPILAGPVLYHLSQFPPREDVSNSTTASLPFCCLQNTQAMDIFCSFHWQEQAILAPAEKALVDDRRAGAFETGLDRRQSEPLRTVLGRTRSISLRGTRVRTLGCPSLLAACTTRCVAAG